MEIVSILIAALLGFFGLTLISALLWLLFGPLIRSIQNRRDTQAYSRAADRIVQSDVYIEEKQYPEALKVLKQSLLFELFEKSEFPVLIREHHQNVLSRCVLIAEEMQARPANLADVERLVMERSQLHSLYVRALDSYSSLRNRRQKAGKEMPDWTRSDFEQRIREIHQELENNEAALSAAFNKLFASIESPQSGGDIVYH